MLFRRFFNKSLARLSTRWPALARRLVESYKPMESRGIPWTPLQKPLKQANLALVTTAGVHHSGQAAFNMADKNGDPSFRILEGALIEKDYTITHDYYDHRDAGQDLNIVFPLARLREMQAAGCIGALSSRHYGFMGHIDGAHIQTLVNDTAPQVARQLLKDAVDAVLLTPA
jgi:D-proline reductase (dithiol) PrdB